MKIASAQIEVKVGDIENNLKKHLQTIEVVSKHNVDLIVFPEMSLSGYCREEALNLSFKEHDARLLSLKEISSNHNITIIVGAPILIKQNLHIGSFIFQPNNSSLIYTKQFLHKGEDLFFVSSFNYNPILNIKQSKISFAICADINNKQHAENAFKNDCDIYIPSIFFSENGIEDGHGILSSYSKKYNFNTLMSNFCGKHWNINSAGRSAFWDRKGEKLSELTTNKEELLIAEKVSDHNWVTKNIQL